MHDQIVQWVKEIVDLEQRIEQELEQGQQAFRYRFNKSRVQFEQEVVESQRQLKVSVLQRLKKAKIGTLLSVPIIYGLAIPLLLADLSVFIYQWSCFTLWGVARVRRRDYWVMDRQQLAYLNWLERINCFYCSYANGLAAYFREVAARTEQYWCPIKHARKVQQPHARYWHFSDYGDAAAYREQLQQFRDELR
ncbi:MAG: hypothetical protein HON68_11990 [Gammaproteobacteria bacterium]|jgi:hypothetical protein|nr:hypothetical protein [Gammaproteobacteria bacterium]MBT3488967.1 hypothetical protein [Gammaproteobacteria bacterium]MBT3717322.1 hypothetical protein [Gammaproteobacteria bacterium]MBT3844722.1 hypothetical protein [Gammaproteobacteria bacterium]MBT3893234.1 hypothetical protein [Gammaproteobacteria bacterium]